jgi:signal transduction histidine kinase/CheY-like chemotaxis protein
MQWLPRWVARLRATIHTKLLAAFLLIALLLLSAAAVGLNALTEMNRRAQETAQLQRKIAAYRQLSHDSITQLYGVSTALLQPEERRLDATLRQLKQFGYDLDRLQFLAQDEIEVMGRVRSDFEEFIKIVTRAVELIREGKSDEGRKLEISVASPLADRLERLTNELVNKAEADLVGGIELANNAYLRSRRTVIICAIVSLILALGLGYMMSWSLIAPIKQMESRMSEIALGNFGNRVSIPNRDELGALANDMNRMSEELGRLYAQVDAERENAERANLDKSRFLAAASHDLRQPMHALNLWVSNLRVALERNDRKSARDAASTIEDACKSMSASFNAILDLSKFDARGIKPELADFNLTDLLRRLYAEFELVARQKGLDLRLRLSRRAPLYVHSDVELLSRSLRNLLGNAVKYTLSGGVVFGEIVRGNTIEVAIYDSGIGIAREHQQDIFAEFFQVANRERDQRQGMGLGLAIVRRSVDMLEGHRLDFYSREGHGSRFSIYVPRVIVETKPTLPLSKSPRSERIPGSYIVVVDDEPRVLQGLMALLKNWGCLVEGGRSSSELLHAISQNERLPDLLIADLRLANGETGVDAARVLHQHISPNIPVLILTGDPIASVTLDDPKVLVKLMHKPIVTEALREVLEDLLPVRQYVLSPPH